MPLIAKRLTIKNLGPHEHTVLEIDRPLLLLYGDTQEGKTTVLNAIRFISGGAVKDGLLRDGAMDGGALLEAEDDGVPVEIERTIYRAKSGAQTTRPVRYEIDGKRQEGPDVARRVAALFNPAQLNERFFSDLKPEAREKYILECFDVDTVDIDDLIDKDEAKAKELRSTIKGFGEVKPVPVELVDVEAVTAERDGLLAEYEAAELLARKQNAEAHDRDLDRSSQERARDAATAEVRRLEEQLVEARGRVVDAMEWLAQYPPIATSEAPQRPDTSDLDAQISDAKAIRVQYEQYQKDVAEVERQEAKRRELESTVSMLAIRRKSRLGILRKGASDCRIEGISISADGQPLFQDTTMAMLSDSQEMELSSLIQGLMPEELRLELLDRGESLGLARRDCWEPIATLVKRATVEERTIVVTVVGDVPAGDIREDVGVFSVDDGTVQRVENEEPADE